MQTNVGNTTHQTPSSHHVFKQVDPEKQRPLFAGRGGCMLCDCKEYVRESHNKPICQCGHHYSRHLDIVSS